MSTDCILVLNAGSATLKYTRYGAHDLTPQQRGCVAHDGSSDGFRTCLASLLDNVLHGVAPVAIGHRVVHGGHLYAAPKRIDTATLSALRALIPLAPLHQPHNLAGIEAIRDVLPQVPQVACFDTAFHRTQAEVAQRYGLPRRYHAAGIRRYGFHGLSYESIVAQLPQHLGPLATGRIVIAHLGNGASVCAVHNGKSIATSMGFSTLDGLLMGTRCGSIDPGVLLYLMQTEGMDAETLTTLLYKESGLLGVSEISSDMRDLLASDKTAAAEAIELFCYRIQREIGSLAAALGGVDALIFTGGIGEHAASIRERISHGLAWLGLCNANVMTLPCDEEGIIAQHTMKLI